MKKINKLFCWVGKQITISICWVTGFLHRIVRFPCWATRLFCSIGWHKKGEIVKAPDDPHQFLNFSQCQWCGFKGQVDSQGNLF